MPRTLGAAKRQTLTDWAAALTSRPDLFAAVTVLIYAALLLPALSRHNFDPSTFIVAGDKFVDRAALAAPIVVRPHSDGYDGQFYYRLAIAPFGAAERIGGVFLDHPAWRMRRILYPLLSHILAFGSPRLVPAAMLAINLLALAGIAFLAADSAGKFRLNPAFPLAIMIWPGFMTALTHDTTEIAAAFFVLAALNAYLGERVWAYAALAALATLTRETALLLAVGILGAEIWSGRKNLAAFGPRILAGFVAIMPYCIWRVACASIVKGMTNLGASPSAIGLPFVGITHQIASAIRGSQHWAHQPMLDAMLRLLVGASCAGLLAFSVLVASSIILRARDPAPRAIAVGWAAIATLMMCLSARGPWVEPTAYFRAFTECWIVGVVVLALLQASLRLLLAITATTLPIFLLNWQLCLIQLR